MTYDLWIMDHDHGLWVMAYGLWFMTYDLWIMIMDHGLWFMVYGICFVLFFCSVRSRISVEKAYFPLPSPVRDVIYCVPDGTLKNG